DVGHLLAAFGNDEIRQAGIVVGHAAAVRPIQAAAIGPETTASVNEEDAIKVPEDVLAFPVAELIEGFCEQGRAVGSGRRGIIAPVLAGLNPIEHLPFQPESAARKLVVIVVYAAIDGLPRHTLVEITAGAEQRLLPVFTADLLVVFGVGILDADHGQTINV